MKRASFVAAALWSCLSFAAPTAAPVRAEIDALLGKLQASGCQFSRNGAWYSGAEARDHLLRKLEYLEGRGTIHSAEEFIELAASSSSSSGKPYQVRCRNESAMESKQWLVRQLPSIRGADRKAKQ